MRERYLSSPLASRERNNVYYKFICEFKYKDCFALVYKRSTQYYPDLYIGTNQGHSLQRLPPSLGEMFRTQSFCYLIFELFIKIYWIHFGEKGPRGSFTLRSLLPHKKALQLLISNRKSILRSLYDHPFYMKCFWEKI